MDEPLLYRYEVTGPTEGEEQRGHGPSMGRCEPHTTQYSCKVMSESTTFFGVVRAAVAPSGGSPGEASGSAGPRTGVGKPSLPAMLDTDGLRMALMPDAGSRSC